MFTYEVQSPGEAGHVRIGVDYSFRVSYGRASPTPRASADSHRGVRAARAEGSGLGEFARNILCRNEDVNVAPCECAPNRCDLVDAARYRNNVAHAA
jgi:hypothetical protein